MYYENGHYNVLNTHTHTPTQDLKNRALGASRREGADASPPTPSAFAWARRNFRISNWIENFHFNAAEVYTNYL